MMEYMNSRVTPKPVRQEIKAKRQENRQTLKNEAKQARANIKQEKINAKLKMTPEELKKKRRDNASIIAAGAAAAGGVVASEVRRARGVRGLEKWQSQHPDRPDYEAPPDSVLRKMGRKNKLF